MSAKLEGLWQKHLAIGVALVAACSLLDRSANTEDLGGGKFGPSISTRSSNTGAAAATPVKPMDPAVAFQKGIASLGGAVDLLDTNGIIRFHRSQFGYWHMLLMKCRGLPFQGQWIRIKDDGSIETGSGP